MPAIVMPPPSSVREARHLNDMALIRLILGYHDAHVRDLAEAVELAEHVGYVHAPSGLFPAGLPAELRDLLSDLKMHQEREENLIFPAILEGRGASLRIPVSAMATDHEAAQERLERLVRLTRDYTPPPEACASWRRLYELCARFDRDFRVHAQLEERVLFPRYL